MPGEGTTIKIAYIAPSSYPSTAAKLVQVIHQCDGLSKVGHEVDLYLGSTRKEMIQDDILRDFEAEFRSVSLIPVQTGKAQQAVRIALHALGKMIGSRYDLVLSPNLYFAWIYSNIFRGSILYEAHDIEKGFRSILQKQLINSNKVTTVLISKKLGQTLEKYYRTKIRKSIIVHDAAPEGSRPVDVQKKRIILSTLVNELELNRIRASDSSTCLQLALEKNPENITAYFGKLNQNSGIERIVELAHKNENDTFLIFGEKGEAEEKLYKEYRSSNLFFLGHVPNGYARRIQATCDILLLPYQGNLPIIPGLYDSKNQTCMSPIKLFEYMASGTPFITSALPVLREVVTDRRDTLMVPAEDPIAWEKAYQELRSNPLLKAELAHQAYRRYQKKFTWTSRARKLVEHSLTVSDKPGRRREAA